MLCAICVCIYGFIIAHIEVWPYSFFTSSRDYQVQNDACDSKIIVNLSAHMELQSNISINESSTLRFRYVTIKIILMTHVKLCQQCW